MKKKPTKQSIRVGQTIYLVYSFYKKPDKPSFNEKDSIITIKKMRGELTWKMDTYNIRDKADVWVARSIITDTSMELFYSKKKAKSKLEKIING